MSQPIFDDELHLAVAKLVCCGSNGCMHLIKNNAEEAERCWCEIPDFKGSNADTTARKIVELFRGKS